MSTKWVFSNTSSRILRFRLFASFIKTNTDKSWQPYSYWAATSSYHQDRPVLHSAKEWLHRGRQPLWGTIWTFPKSEMKDSTSNRPTPPFIWLQVSRRSNFTLRSVPGECVKASPCCSASPDNPVQQVFTAGQERRALLPWCSEPPGWPCSPDSCPPVRERPGFHTAPPGRTSGEVRKTKSEDWVI